MTLLGQAPGPHAHADRHASLPAQDGLAQASGSAAMPAGRFPHGDCHRAGTPVLELPEK